MKRILPTLILLGVASFGFAAEKSDSKRSNNIVVLDEIGVKNLRIETVEAESADFEEIIFALGRIKAIPSKTAAVSSRVPGRIIELKVEPGDQVAAGQDARRWIARLTALQTRHILPSCNLIAGLDF